MSILSKVRAAVTKGDDTAKMPAPLVSRRAGQNGSLYSTTSGGNRTDQLGAMANNGTLYAVVDALSTGVAALVWHLYAKPKPGESVKPEDREIITAEQHAAALLMERPNPFFTTSLLVETGQQHMELAAESIIILSKVGSLPVEMWPVNPARMYPVPDPKKYLAGWLYVSPDGEKIPFKVDEVLHQRKPDPLDPYRGLSAVQAINVDLQAGKYAAQWNRNFFLNSAEPGGVIELPIHLSDPQWDEFTTRWREQHQGVSRAHRVAVLEYGGKYVPTSISQRDMQFAELRHDARDTVMEAFRVSKTALGITDDVNRASALASEYQRSKTLIVPRGNRWRDMFNTQLLPMFDGTAEGYEFGYESPVEEDAEAENAERESKARAAQIYVTAGWNPISVQEKLGLPEMEYGDGVQSDPDRDLMISLVKAAPAALASLLLPVLLPNVDFAAAAAATAPPAPELPPGQDPNAPVDPNAPAPNDPNAPPPGAPAGAGDPAKGKDPFPGNRHVHDLQDMPEGVPSLDPVSEAWEAALERVLDQWRHIAAAQRAELRTQLINAVDAGDLEALSMLHCSSDDAGDLIGEALTNLASKAAAQVVADNPTIDLRPVTPDGLDQVAKAIARMLADDLATAAGREALRVTTTTSTGDQVASHVVTVLTERSTATVESQVGGALTGAQNSARARTYASGPVGSLYADERLDGSTCANCRAHHGRFVCTTDDLRPYERLYTAMGGYVDCLGGVRCRGTVTGVWRPTATEGS